MVYNYVGFFLGTPMFSVLGHHEGIVRVKGVIVSEVYAKVFVGCCRCQLLVL